MTQPETLTASQQAMVAVLDAHEYNEFGTRDIDETMKTMTDDPYLHLIPVQAGGMGKDQVREFYSLLLRQQLPPDLDMTPVSRTVGNERIVEELILKFTHIISMDWLLPGVPPTGKRVEFLVAVVFGFQDGKIAYEHVYWDQASVLVQLGLIESESLPVVGVETAHRVLDPQLPSNVLIRRSGRSP